MSRTVWPPALGLVLVLGACQPSQTVSLPIGPQVVDVEMADYRFQYKQPVSNGRVLFRVANTGKANHSLSLLPLSDDIPPIDQQLRGSERRAVIPVAAIKARPPGTTTSFAVDLAPDRRYAMVCFVEDAEGSHALRGMASEFRVAGTPTEPGSTGTSTSTGAGSG